MAGYKLDVFFVIDESVWCVGLCLRVFHIIILNMYTHVLHNTSETLFIPEEPRNHEGGRHL